MSYKDDNYKFNLHQGFAFLITNTSQWIFFLMRCHKTSPEIVSPPFCSESLSTILKSRVLRHVRYRLLGGIKTLENKL